MSFGSYVRYFFYDLADPRIRDRFFMGSPYPILVWTIFFVVLVKCFLKPWMKNRPAYNIRSVSIVLYSFNVMACAFFVIKIAPYWLTKYNWRCEPLDTSHSKDALEMVNIAHLFVLFKASYMLETIIGMLGKRPIVKSNYLFLHHVAQTSIVWVPANFYPGGHDSSFVLINTFCHLLMETYYLFGCLLFPAVKDKTKWIKNLLMWFILFQMLLSLVHHSQLIFSNPCNIPTAIIISPYPLGIPIILGNIEYIKKLSRRKDFNI